MFAIIILQRNHHSVKIWDSALALSRTPPLHTSYTWSFNPHDGSWADHTDYTECEGEGPGGLKIPSSSLMRTGVQISERGFIESGQSERDGKSLPGLSWISSPPNWETSG